MRSIAGRIAGWLMLFLGACNSGSRAEMEGPGPRDGWHAATRDSVPAGQAGPLIEILVAVNDRYYRKKDESVVWDDKLSYFPWVWTAGQKKKFSGTDDV